MFLLGIILSVAAASPPPTKFQCYPVVNCLSNDWPWSGPTRKIPPPQHPLNVSTRVSLYTRNDTSSFPIFPEVDTSAVSLTLDRPTFVIFHSFMLNATSEPILSIKDALLRRVDGNVMIPEFSNRDGYAQTVGNARIVAKLVARALLTVGVNASDVHFIGTQLGAQIAGLTDKVILESGSSVGHITALDPPGYLFEDAAEETRLDWTDAEYVEVIHTNAGNYGLLDPMGDVDFYINGGRSQPACENETDVNMCSHWLSINYYIEAIDSHCLYGEPAIITLEVPSGTLLEVKPTSSPTTDRVVLGLEMSSLGVYYVPTAQQSPFCTLKNQNTTIIPY